MTRRALLWIAAATVFGFMFLAAVNSSSPDPQFGFPACTGFDSIDDWFSDAGPCKALLPSRLALVLVGVGLAAVPIYFAEKDRPPGPGEPAELVGGHEVLGSGSVWQCWEDDCDFVAHNRRDARAHRMATGATLAPVRQEQQPPTQAVKSDATKLCPDCAEEVRAAARKCRFCGYAFGVEPSP